MSSDRIVNVGLIGCGEVVQTIHIPNLNHFKEYFKITYLCDSSEQALKHCEAKVAGPARPRLSKDAAEVCSSPDVEVVLIVKANEYHAPHAVLALQHGKVAFIEKLMAMNNRDVQLIFEAERKSKGTVMVGYMRRYATAFIDAVKEIGGLEKVTYARVRDIIGQNAKELSERNADCSHQGLTEDLGVPVNKESAATWLLLGGLGSHDLSLMREALDMPQSVFGCSLNANTPFWTATKQVTVQYDTPYIKGLPVIMTIRENGDGGYQERLVRKTYEDPYTLEYKALYALVMHGEPVKTTAEDAAQDLRVFQMIMRAGRAQFNAR